jgi:hypothetical protein
VGLRATGRAAAIVAIGLGCTACGGASTGSFAWLHPQPPPRGWLLARIPTGAELPYPPGWRIVHGDGGTATAALVDAGGRYVGYLNVTPRQGAETLAGWASFRTAHNVDEGDHVVKRLAAAINLRFRTGRGSCVKDSYATEVQTHYVEIACLVAGRTATTVIVGASPPSSWATTSGVLERAIEGFTT